jgi:hypothetical protein
VGAGSNPLQDPVWYAERIYGDSNGSVASATSVAIKGGAGILCQAIVTTVGTGTCTFYDNPSAASGTVLFVIPASAALGTIYAIRMPAMNGIYAVSAASGPVVAVSYL